MVKALSEAESQLSKKVEKITANKIGYAKYEYLEAFQKLTSHAKRNSTKPTNPVSSQIDR